MYVCIKCVSACVCACLYEVHVQSYVHVFQTQERHMSIHMCYIVQVHSLKDTTNRVKFTNLPKKHTPTVHTYV